MNPFRVRIGHRRSLIFVAALSIAALIVAACVPVAAPAADSPAEAVAESEQGGTLTIGSVQGSAVIPTFLPWKAHSSAQSFHWNLFMNSLVMQEHSTLKWVPDLAESYEISSDGLTYTFHLREGVTWHDGMPFTANDVSFSFHAALLPEGGSTASGGLKDAIKGAVDFQEGNAETAEGIKVLDDYTIQFELVKPQVTIIERFAMRIAPAHVFEGLEPEEWLQTEFATELPFGTGPFVFKEYIPDQHTIFERNDDYFKGAPLLKNTVIRFYGDNSVMIIALEKGEINMVGFLNPSADEFDKVTNLPGVDWEYQDKFPAYFFSITFQDEALADKRFRQAFLYSIDRAEIATQLWGNADLTKVQPAVQWAPPPGVTLEIEEYAYNPEKSTALLEEMGWDFDRVVEVVWFGADMPDQLPILQQFIEAAGIKTKLVQTDGARGLEVFYETGDYEISWVGGWGRSYYPETTNLGCDRIYPNGYNSPRYCNEELDALYNQALATVDDDERNELYTRASAIWNDELPWIPLYAPQSLLLIHESVKGWRDSLIGSEGSATIGAVTDLEKWYIEE